MGTGAANTFVSALLRSPLHGLLSGSTCVVCCTGRRSHRQFTTPTQHARDDDEVVILVSRAETETWWRNVQDDREIDLLLDDGGWR